MEPMLTSSRNSHDKTDRPHQKYGYYGNQISRIGIVSSSIIFILLFIFNIIFLIWIWPDRMPEPHRTYPPIYIIESKNFQSRLLDSVEHIYLSKNEPETEVVGGTGAEGSVIIAPKSSNKEGGKGMKEFIIVHLNNLLFILVVLAGFLGNLIHIASSFTTFVGLQRFKRSWLMWYYVKPFIAAALALAVYIVFRGGFTSMTYVASNINPYAIVSLGMLTGLFTSAITDKLEKLLDVIFPGVKQTANSTKEPLLKSISPDKILRGTEETFTISGDYLDKLKKPFILINGTKVVPKLNENEFTFSYTHEKNDNSEKIKIVVGSENGTLGSFSLDVVEISPEEG